MKRLPPIHPGEVLQDAIKEAGLTVRARAYDVVFWGTQERLRITCRSGLLVIGLSHV